MRRSLVIVVDFSVVGFSLMMMKSPAPVSAPATIKIAEKDK